MQVKIYGIRERLRSFRETLSDIVQECLTEAFGLPEQQRLQCFIGLDREDFIRPSERSEHYTYMEIVLSGAVSDEAKRTLVRLLYERTAAFGFAADDLEIVLIDAPVVEGGRPD